MGWFSWRDSLPGPSATCVKQFHISSKCVFSSLSCSTISCSRWLRPSRHLSKAFFVETRFRRSRSIWSLNALNSRSCWRRPMTSIREPEIWERWVFMVVSASEMFLILRETRCTRCCLRWSIILPKLADWDFASSTNFCRSYFNVSNFRAPFEASIKFRSNSSNPFAPSVSSADLELVNCVLWVGVVSIYK